MSGLAACLTGLSVILAGRASRIARRRRTVDGLRAAASRPAGPGSIAPGPAGPDDPSVRDRLLSWRWPASGALVGAVVSGPVGAGIGLAAGFGVRRWREARARRAAVADRDEQLADATRAIAAGSRSGGSLEHALDHAATESPEPLAADLRGIVSAISLGVPVGEALESWASASESEDVRLLVGALELHRRSGGDLPFMLDGIAATLRDRRAAAREIQALTAQARLSGAIVGFLPLGFFGFLWMTSPDDMGTAFRSSIGLGAVGLGLLMEGAAFLWIRHLLEIR